MTDEIRALIQSLQTVTDLMQENNVPVNLDEVRCALVKASLDIARIYAVALSSQEHQAALTQRIRELEKEVLRLKDWNRKAQRYEPYTPIDGSPATIHRLKPGMEQGETPHYLCTHCFENQEESRIEFPTEVPEVLSLRCPRCGNTYT